MKKIFHWTISIVVAVFLGMMAIGCVAGLGYALYLIVTEATVALVIAAVIGIGYWIGSYIERNGFAWSPTRDDEPADEVKP